MQAEGAGKTRELLCVSTPWHLAFKFVAGETRPKLCSTNREASRTICEVVEKESMAVFADQVRELNERVVELSRSYAIFWAFISGYKKHCKVIDDHRDFFDAIASSLFQGFCVITYALFDNKRTDVKSLPSMICYLSSLNPDLERQLKSKIDVERPLLDKYFSLRHKIYAHRDKAKSPSELFGKVPKARLKREMAAIVRLSRDTVCALACASGVGNKADLAQEIRRRENYARWDARLVLEALEKQSI